MAAVVFKPVWYRSRALTLTNPTVMAIEDRGSLQVSEGCLRFQGKKETIEITGIEKISAKRAGRDIVNKWIVIEYSGSRVAMFVDGGYLGWRGILGGNKRLLEAILNANPSVR
jgi:hypothetical protein